MKDISYLIANEAQLEERKSVDRDRDLIKKEPKMTSHNCNEPWPLTGKGKLSLGLTCNINNILITIF